MSKRKLQASDENLNQDYCDFLLELADFEKNVSRNSFKHAAYRKAASTLSRHPSRIASGREARQLDGVGAKIAAKIQEFIDTGHLAKLDKIRSSEDVAAITQLTRVSGIGPAKARQLVDAGVTSLDQLRQRAELLNHHQQTGLRYVEEFESRIPRAEVATVEEHVRRCLKQLDARYKATVCGSYRRGAKTSGDVDVLVTHPLHLSTDEPPAKRSAGEVRTSAAGLRTGGHLLKDVVDELKKDDFITETLSQGDSKFMGVCLLPGEQYSVHRRLDLLLIPYDEYFCALLYFTGSDEFNRRMRAHALQQKFTLNEHNLRPLGVTGTPGEPVAVNSEREIFEYLDFLYKEPQERSE